MLPRLKAGLKLLIVFAAIVSITFLFAQTYLSSSNDKETVLPKKRFNPDEPCLLPSLDPWDKSISRYLNPKYRPMGDCEPTFQPITRISNGRIELIKELAGNTTECQFRCNYPLSDYDVRFGPWKSISFKPDCDVFEVYCTDESGQSKYEYPHAQIYVADEHPRPIRATATANPRASSSSPPSASSLPSNRLPDVHMLILDSVSSAQLTRSMPKTMHFLREEMAAVNFRFVNKIGLNSRPNAYALLLGKQSYKLTDAGQQGKAFPADVDGEKFCYKPLDDEPFVGFEFRRRAYKTMMAEDWALGAFNWFNCTGFNRTPVDHYMRPFQFLYDHSEDWSYWNLLTEERCRGIHLYLLDYFKEFLSAYDDQPKFSITWISYLAHDTPNGLYELDEEVFELIRKYKQKLNNSFLFLMGDHGLRFGKIRRTKQGEIEDNNPALVLTVPEHLRSNHQLMANLNANSKQLITHYDTFATLMNIAREGSDMSASSSFTNLDTSEWNTTLHGQSYLYPFADPKPRNCANQRIPFEYCICQNSMEDVSWTKLALALRIAAFVVDQMNEIVRTNNASKLCRPLTPGTGHGDVELLQIAASEDLYRLTMRTLPNKARYSTHVKVTHEDDVGGKEAFTIVAQKITRLDSYEKQSRCVKRLYDVRPFCYCKNLVS